MLLGYGTKVIGDFFAVCTYKIAYLVHGCRLDTVPPLLMNFDKNLFSKLKHLIRKDFY